MMGNCFTEITRHVMQLTYWNQIGSIVKGSDLYIIYLVMSTLRELDLLTQSFSKLYWSDLLEFTTLTESYT